MQTVKCQFMRPIIDCAGTPRYHGRSGYNHHTATNFYQEKILPMDITGECFTSQFFCDTVNFIMHTLWKAPTTAI